MKISVNKPNLILVDDHKIYRQGLKSIIEIENIATVIGEASNGFEFIDLLSSLKPDMVVLDIDMPKMNGLVATEVALKMVPDLKIIVFTMFGDDEYYQKMLSLGAKGYILKTNDISELEMAIKKIMNGEVYYSQKRITV